MKKLLVAVALLVASSFIFANDSYLENLLDYFWRDFDHVKIIENDKITYVNKSAISTIELDGDTLTIINNTYNTQAKASWTLNTSKNYRVDENSCAIVLTKK